MMMRRWVLIALALLAFPAGASAASRTVVSLTFDDALASQMNAASRLAAHGMHGTFFIISGKVGKPGQMTWAQVQSLAAAGNEIGGHTIDHPDLTKLTPAAAQAEICNDRTALQSHGLTVTDFAYPFGRTNATVEGIVKGCGYASARTTNAPDLAESIPPADPYATLAYELDANVTLAQIESGIQNIEQNGGGWVQLVFHDVCDGCDPTYGISPALLGSLLDWLGPRAAQGTVVRTIGEVINGAVPPPPPPPPPPANLLSNPSLEAPATGATPTCWELRGWGTNTASAARVADAHSGKFGEQLTIGAYTDGEQMLVSARDGGTCAPAVSAAHTYRLSAWYHSTVPVYFVAYTRDASGVWTRWGQSAPFSASATWTQAQLTTPPVPAGATALSFGLAIGQAGTATFDDFGLSLAG